MVIGLWNVLHKKESVKIQECKIESEDKILVSEWMQRIQGLVVYSSQLQFSRLVSLRMRVHAQPILIILEPDGCGYLFVFDLLL